ncbi:MAG: efflux RND transporter periplasmic adaptor subunit [Gammaproteobacteria bacterium]|nr:efflux RND transporter periplasmic adaptor subunit [Gammaproteobacteria bacterium]
MNDNKQAQEPALNTRDNPKKQWPIVLVIFIVAIGMSFALYVFKPEAEKKISKEEHPLAEYVVANIEPVAVPVFSQGSVTAKTYIKLVAQVSGRITHMEKLKINGGFFKKGDLLLSIDDTDYRLAMSRAKAIVAAAQQQLVRVETEAGQARYDLQQIGRDPSKSTAYALREPQLAEAKANLQAAKADLEIARLQMQRTNVTAPFDGRVVNKQVDIGQFVSSGTLLADIYSTESVIVRLPLSLQKTKLLGIKLRNNEHLVNDIKINLIAESATRKYQWKASLSHTEGELDARNRLLYLVAEVESPYEEDDLLTDRPPLTPGMFVKAELTGIDKDIIKLPRKALRYGEQIWLLDELNQLQKRQVEILSKDRKYVYIKSGIQQGEKIIINAIDYPLQGMKLSPQLISSVNQSEDISSHE